jgi:hypothetical protein
MKLLEDGFLWSENPVGKLGGSEKVISRFNI